MQHGRPFNLTTGLYDHRARSYSPTLGRFLQTDPLGYADSMNVYQGFNMNPINFLDPLGEGIFKDLWNADWGWATKQTGKDLARHTWGGVKQIGSTIAFIVDAVLRTTKLIDDAAWKVTDMVGWKLGIWEENGIYEDKQFRNLVCAYYFANSTTFTKAGKLVLNKIRKVPGKVEFFRSKTRVKSTSTSSGSVTYITKDKIDLESMVRFDPSIHDTSIQSEGILTKYFDNKKIWLTKYKHVENVDNAKDLEKILYRKDLWPSVEGKYQSGATLRMIENSKGVKAAGVTNKTKGIPQWRKIKFSLWQNIKLRV
jgi:RHS repeat-associated protein